MPTTDSELRRPTLDTSPPSGRLQSQPSANPSNLPAGIPDEVDAPIEAQPTSVLPPYNPPVRYGAPPAYPGAPAHSPLPTRDAGQGAALTAAPFHRERWRAWVMDTLVRARYGWVTPDGKPHIAMKALQQRLSAVDPKRRTPEQWRSAVYHLTRYQPTMELAFLLARALDMAPWAFMLHGGLMTPDQLWYTTTGSALYSRAELESLLDGAQHLPPGENRDAQLLDLKRALDWYVSLETAIADYERYLSPDDYGTLATERLATELGYGAPGHRYPETGPSQPVGGRAWLGHVRVAQQFADEGLPLPGFGGPFATQALRAGVELPTETAERRARQPGPRYQATAQELANFADDERMDEAEREDEAVVDADPPRRPNR